jgi:hypothetical protein
VFKPRSETPITLLLHVQMYRARRAVLLVALLAVIVAVQAHEPRGRARRTQEYLQSTMEPLGTDLVGDKALKALDK